MANTIITRYTGDFLERICAVNKNIFKKKFANQKKVVFLQAKLQETSKRKIELCQEFVI
ncbi:MAG: hypothetical protein ACOXZ9_01035 [Bacteroidales bacterium]